MSEKIFFYRKLNSAEFVACDHEKTVVPVRAKNKFVQKNAVFDAEAKKWETVDVIPTEDENQIVVEYAETPKIPQFPDLFSSFIDSDRKTLLEDLSPSDMQKFLDYRLEQERSKLNYKLFVDSNEIEKDYFGAIFETDEKKLTFRLSFLKFDRSNEKDPKILPDDVVVSSEEYFFNLKSGNFSRNLDYLGVYGTYKRKTTETNEFLSEKSSLYPKDVLFRAYEKLLTLAEKFTKINLSVQKDDWVKRFDNSEKHNILTEMFLLTKLPYEPKLYPVIFSSEFEEAKRKFRVNRKDSKILKNFLRKMKIRDYRVLRKCYAENPEILLVYLILQDCGFKDINLYNRVIEDKGNCIKITNFARKSIVFFSNKCIEERGEIATMNILLHDYEDSFETTDAMDMFADYFKYIPETLRKDVFTDGFTNFNHDALSNLTYRVKNKNYTFSYSPKQKKLEDDVNGYEFRLPETSYQMCEIGTSLHNCVASYAKKVQNNECTIVYARKDGEYKICIELRGNEKSYHAVQELIDHNKSPTEEESAALKLWHDRHSILR